MRMLSFSRVLWGLRLLLAVGPLAAQGGQLRLHSPREKERTPVWIWWDWTDVDKSRLRGVYNFNLASWRRHAPADKFDLHLLNRSNIGQFVPDLPAEFFRLYPAAQSDFIRSNLLAERGGVYIDGDMMLMHDLDVVLREFLDGEEDLVVYRSPGEPWITTNFMAGRRGNVVCTDWAAEWREQLKQRCLLEPESPLAAAREKPVCCYDDETQPCHVAFGSMACRFADTKIVQHTKSGDMDRWKAIPDELGFQADGTSEFLFNRLVAEPQDHVNLLSQEEKKTQSCWRIEDDVMCQDGLLRKGLFRRHGIHLFANINGDKFANVTGTIVEALYQQAGVDVLQAA